MVYIVVVYSITACLTAHRMPSPALHGFMLCNNNDGILKHMSYLLEAAGGQNLKDIIPLYLCTIMERKSSLVTFLFKKMALR